ncbi:tyrosine-protein phosphatase [Streptomyces sp. SID14478]|uniref:tyrosine-protein phosphatase n=1 Tax=Streptomyces sp. SID14478 TaxID=2706073 RepID=UPI0013DAE794|nr:tyrosine-protein phosphatase [Streptomyces sp. SID14478]NEB79346.1 tyrosine-protein phosphatase [Streptomyces sp. SID14478]
MSHMTRVRTTAYALSAAALLTGLTAPAASAHENHHHRNQHHDNPAATARIPFTRATVTAKATAGTYEISWQAPGTHHVTIKAGTRTVARGGASGKVTVTRLPAHADRQWFDLVPDHGKGLHLADRLIKLDGTVNFRDAGGYRTADGHWVKMGKVYRADALNNLTSADLARLKRLGIGTDYDLRTTAERTAAPDKVPAGTSYVVANVIGDDSPIFTMPATEAAAAEMMIQGEKSMVSSDTAKAAYRSVMAGIVQGGGDLFHCSAGKDRTGWANATLLTALGVPRETVTADYLASNDYRAEANAAALAAMPADQAKAYKPMLDVRAEYLNSGFDEVKDKYGSFGAYERQALGLDARDLARLQHDLLV